MVEDGENGFEKFMFHNLDSEEYELLKPISPSIVIEIKCNDSEWNSMLVNLNKSFKNKIDFTSQLIKWKFANDNPEIMSLKDFF